MAGRHLISLLDFDPDGITRILDVAVEMRANPDHFADALCRRTLFMYFEKPSLRTRVTFEAGMTQLGGHAIYYTGTDGGLWKSVNGGTSFTNLNGNVNSFLFYAVGVDAQDPDRICGGAQDNSSVARSSNNVWSLQAVTGDGFTCHIDPQNANYSYITSYPSGGYPNVWRSTGGLFGGYGDITGGGRGIVQNDRINWVTPYLIDPLNPNVLYLGTHRIYRSDNFGSNWTQMGPDLTGNSGSLSNIGINRNFSSTLLTHTFTFIYSKI